MNELVASECLSNEETLVEDTIMTLHRFFKDKPIKLTCMSQQLI